MLIPMSGMYVFFRGSIEDPVPLTKGIKLLSSSEESFPELDEELRPTFQIGTFHDSQHLLSITESQVCIVRVAVMFMTLRPNILFCIITC